MGRSASSFLLIKREPFAHTKAVEFMKPSVPAETLRACALIGLHLMAAGGGSGFSSCGVFSQELGRTPGLSGPRYLCGKTMYLARGGY